MHNLLTPLFPSMLATNAYNGNLYEEYVYCRSLEFETMDSGLLVSKDRNVLDAEAMDKVRTCVEFSIKSYLTEGMGYQDVNFKVESWVVVQPTGVSLLKTKSDGFIGGMFHFTNEDKVPVNLHNFINIAQPAIEKQNMFNTSSWKMTGQKGAFSLFPSRLEYSIDENSSHIDVVTLMINVKVD